MRRSISSIKSVTAAAVILLGNLPAARADLAATRSFSIPPQALSSALIEFSKQADVQVVGSTETLVNLDTGGVAGEHTGREALRLLLETLPITFEEVTERSVRILPQKAVEVARQDAAMRLAQADSPAANAEQPKPSESDTPLLDEIVVTGTHIRGVAPSSSPLTIYQRADIERMGVSTMDQFLRRIPQNFAGVDASTVNNNLNNLDGNRNSSFGTAINLRGLGVGGTLTLINGHRMAGSGVDASFVDVGLIPLSAIERVEILTDGASAIYGADAVAGVVNFVLRKDFEGAETTMRTGTTTQGGGDELGASQLFGSAWRSGSAVIALDYRSQDSIDAADRSFLPPAAPGERMMVQPDTTQKSVFFTAQQQLSSTITLLADAIYSKRDFFNETSNLGQFSSSDGATEGYGGTLGLNYDLGAWQIRWAADYSKTREHVVSTALFRDFLGPGLDFTDILGSGRNAFSKSTDLRADGPWFDIGGGPVRVSGGLGLRRDGFDGDTKVAGGAFEREITSVFAEAFFPIVGDRNARALLQRLELSLAGRVDDYDDVGTSGFKPKAGLLWSPLRGLNLRGTFAKSFRAPLLSALSTENGLPFKYFVNGLIPDPDAPDGRTTTLFPAFSGNPDLDPETSESFTFGLDIAPQRWPGFKFSATYYDIDFTDRIALPPIEGNLFLIHSQKDTLAPFLDYSPDLALVESFYDPNVGGGVNTFPANIPAQAVEAIFDLRMHNIAETRSRGVEFSADYDLATSWGDIGFFFKGDRILDFDFTSVSTVPTVSLYDKVFSPSAWKVRSGVNWSKGPLDASLAVNYIDSMDNVLVVPQVRVESWTTADVHFAYHFLPSGASSSFEGATVALNVLNLTDEAPPFVETPQAFQTYTFNYDATNASAIGRALSLQLGVRW